MCGEAEGDAKCYNCDTFFLWTTYGALSRSKLSGCSHECGECVEKYYCLNHITECDLPDEVDEHGTETECKCWFCGEHRGQCGNCLRVGCSEHLSTCEKCPQNLCLIAKRVMMKRLHVIHVGTNELHDVPIE